MVDDVAGVCRVEIVEYRHDDGAVGNRAHEVDNPVGGILSQEGDFVARLDA